jgi:hypothetical protein
MRYLKIQNNGELDIRLVALMGGTTKANDKYKIGQFGTGLKYTLAYLFRNNIDFKIFTGTEKIEIDVVKENIKDNDFNIIRINQNQTGITTQMGSQWTAWMIIRELWCNALDEGEPLKDSDCYKCEGEAGKTTFFIQVTPEIKEVLDKWDSYFIHKYEPLWEDENYAIHHNDNKGSLKLYKQGVLIYEHKDTKSLFNYDIKGADINELREFRGLVSMEVHNALMKPNEEVITYFLNNIKEDMYEGSELDYDWFQSFGNIWKETLKQKRVAKSGTYSSWGEKEGVNIDFTNVIELPKKVFAALTKSFEGISALALSDDKNEFIEIPELAVVQKITKCVKMLSQSGYNLNSEMKIKYGVFENVKKTFAINKDKKTLMISSACESLDDSEIMNILVENNEYFVKDLRKDSSDFYSHFVNLYTKELLKNSSVLL